MFQESYDEVEAEYLLQINQQIESANDQSKHAECWKMINNITGRKTQRRLSSKVIRDRVCKAGIITSQTYLGRTSGYR